MFSLFTRMVTSSAASFAVNHFTKILRQTRSRAKSIDAFITVAMIRIHIPIKIIAVFSLFTASYGQLSDFRVFVYVSRVASNKPQSCCGVKEGATTQ